VENRYPQCQGFVVEWSGDAGAVWLMLVEVKSYSLAKILARTVRRPRLFDQSRVVRGCDGEVMCVYEH